MLDPTKYDDVDWHEGAAYEAGYSREHGFTHIGLYLAWVIRHDMHAPEFWPEDHIAGVRAGTMTGSDLADDCDWKLISDTLSSEGVAFSDARYRAYVEAYNDVFASGPEYSIVEDTTSYAQVAPTIDRLYEAWVDAGRPVAPPEDTSELDAKFDEMLANVDFDFEALPQSSRPTAIRMAADGSWQVEELAYPHEAPDLEALITEELVGTDAHRMSSTAADWGSSLLTRALKRLNVRPRDSHVASALSGDPETMLAVTLYRVPGASAERLGEEFGSVIHRPTKRPWAKQEIGGRVVNATDGDGFGEGVNVIWWAVDGLVVHAIGNPGALDRSALRLP